MISSISFQIFTSLLAQFSISLLKMPICTALANGHDPPEPSPAEIKSALDKHDIYKHLNLSHYPNHTLQVRYEDRTGPILVEKSVQLGNKIPEELPFNAPSYINFSHFEPDTWYTLIMVGLDNPSIDRPVRRCYLHWIVGNIPENGNVKTEAETLVPYQWMENVYYLKGIHRLVFLLYKQPDENSHVFDERFWMRSNLTFFREYYRVSLFSKKYRLGEPVAVNFFEVELKETGYPLDFKDPSPTVINPF